MSASEADRLQIDYRKGRKARVNTANGKTTMYRVKFDKVSVGDITVYDVEGAVAESEENTFEPLLGMSFLNRTDMRREGNVMTLTKRY
jgi:aspartyl protease family protein